MSGREELAETVRLELRKGGYQMPGDTLPYETQARSIAGIILAAGYRKPRTIATAEDLDALPFESVIRDGDECVLERWGDMEESGWVTVMVTSFVPRDQITLPATVLYDPSAK